MVHHGKDSELKVNTISRAHYERITAKVGPAARTVSIEEQRLELKKLSDERANRWPNTLEGMMRKKEADRQARAEAHEAEMQEIDRQEAAYRAEQRRVTLEKAQKQLFDQTDRVRELHSKLLVSDVLRENAANRELKGEINALRRLHAAKFDEQAKARYEEEEVVLRAQEEARRAAVLRQRDDQLAQLEEVKTKIRAERAEANRLGTLIKIKAQEEGDTMARKDAAARLRARAAALETGKANDVLQQFKAMERERDKQASLAIEAYAKKKEEIAAERKLREGAVQARKDEARAHLEAVMAAQFRPATKVRDDLVEQHAREMEAKRDAYDRTVAAKRAAMIKEIDRFCKLQLADKAAAREASTVADREFAAAWGHRLAELQDEELQEMIEKRLRNNKVAHFQKWQSGMKQRRADAAKTQAMQDAWQCEETVVEQEEAFQAYAEEQLRDYASRGRNIKPITIYLDKKPKLVGLLG